MNKKSKTTTGKTIPVQSPFFSARISCADDISMTEINTKNFFRFLEPLHFDLGLQAGRQYDLFKYNMLADKVRCEYKSHTQNANSKQPSAVICGSAFDLDIACRFEFLPGERAIIITARVKKNGFMQHKYQLVFGFAFRELSNGCAVLLPGKSGCGYFRSQEPSGQEIYDEDSHGTFPRAQFLPEHRIFVCSAREQRCMEISGDTLDFFSFNTAPGTAFFNIYGPDAWLGKEQEHTAAVKIRFLDKDQLPDNLPLAIASQRYICSKILPVYTLRPVKAYSKVRLKKNQKIILEQVLKNKTLLNLSGLADGSYILETITEAEKSKCIFSEPIEILIRQSAEYSSKKKSLENFLSLYKSKTGNAVARVRIALLKWKLSELAHYLTCREQTQINGLLKDSFRIADALGKNEPAVLPERKKVIYENNLFASLDNFKIIGAGKIQFSRENGMLLEPVLTMNLWSEFSLSGSYMIEFDYYSLEGSKGGTMIQLCGRHPNPVWDYSFMPSASGGSMNYYNFGIFCYHFSFARGQSLNVKGPIQKHVCNFRKTGKGFYILSQIPDPVNQPLQWYKVSFIKNKNRFLFFVNQKLVQEYIDEGHQGPVLEKGAFGIRNWSTKRSYFKNLIISKI
ncbi:MAG: hypothetical protein A2096_14135 [Spirochaetes bacterium GWF1_41_5]|nr:MAG: hypothetical protein A2096_14135 [Spirochaetes bacterium GWF1_41_5]HBE02838.1 hypothetical protein [Spirochaetia bacterium]